MSLSIFKNHTSWRFLCIGACCGFFLSAKSPRGILPPDNMAEVLAELELAKAASSYNRAEDDAKIFFRKNEIEIFEAHDISPEVFERSYNYYIDRPEEFLAIYNSVVLRLETLL